MKKVVDFGNKRRSINVIDNIVYSHVKDMDGNPVELKLSIMTQNGNSELKLAMQGAPVEEEKLPPRPAIVWIPGGGYRGCDKNLMLAEMMFLADAGFIVASIYYRSSAQGHFPDQIIDVKTAVRFLRAHAAEYEIDPERIGVIGRSAGGHLAALAGCNVPGYDSEEWSGYSSEVQAVCDMFGPVDFPMMMDDEKVRMKEDPTYRWKTVEETHLGALMGGDVNTMRERGKEASPTYQIEGHHICPMLILHGTVDPLVSLNASEKFYDELVAAGYEDQTDFYILTNAGHGSREFFQPEIKEIIENFFKKWLKKQ